MKKSKKKLLKKGDVVRVWSLQSFHGGGFLNGEKAIVRQDQMVEGSSVLLIVERNSGSPDGKMIIDGSYEVYREQCKLLKNKTSKLLSKLDKC